jgi:hypothetical protein
MSDMPPPLRYTYQGFVALYTNACWRQLASWIDVDKAPTQAEYLTAQ